METKTKIKNLFALAIALIFSLNANAQGTAPSTETENYDQGFRLGFGLNGGYVFEDPFGASVAGDIRLQYDLSKSTSLTLTTGYTHFFTDGDAEDLGIIPVKAGFKAFIWEDQFYLLGEVGAGFVVTNDTEDDTTLILSPGIGWVASKYIDLSLRYEYYNDFADIDNNKGIGQIALRLAYGFRL